jgi:hypothetical protein
MMNLSIVKESIRESMLQPAFIFVVIIEFFLVSLLLFGIQLDYQQHVLVSLKLFGKVFDGEDLSVFRNEITSNLTSFLASLLMFLFILTSSFVSLKSVNHPLVPVIITRPVTRTSFYFSNVGGAILAMVANVIAFSLLSSVVLLLKGGDWSFSLIRASLSFSVEIVVVASLASLFSFTTGNSAASTILTIAVYYVLSPLMSRNLDATIRMVSYVVPNFWEITIQTKALVMGKEAIYVPHIVGLVYAAFCQIVCLTMFVRRDIP